LFSDIVRPMRGAGIDLDIVPDVGPVIARPGARATRRSRLRGDEKES